MRTIQQAMEWAQGMNGKPAPGGPHHCQELIRTAYGLPAWAPSALDAWKRIPHDQLHPGDNIYAVPAGAMAYYSFEPYGHVVLSLGGGKCLTTDYCKPGQACIAPITLPHWAGEMHWLGWSMWTPAGVAH